MTRATAYQILTRYLTNPVLLQHSLAMEASMRSLAVRLEGDVEVWALTGLLHDADYEKAKGHPEKHTLLLFELEPNSIPSVIEQAIKSHNAEYSHITPQSSLDWALLCSDELTGIIHELSQREKDKDIHTLTPQIVLEKLNDKNSFRQVDKKTIFLCEEKLEIPLEEFVGIILTAMQKVVKEGINAN